MSQVLVPVGLVERGAGAIAGKCFDIVDAVGSAAVDRCRGEVGKIHSNRAAITAIVKAVGSCPAIQRGAQAGAGRKRECVIPGAADDQAEIAEGQSLAIIIGSAIGAGECPEVVGALTADERIW